MTTLDELLTKYREKNLEFWNTFDTLAEDGTDVKNHPEYIQAQREVEEAYHRYYEARKKAGGAPIWPTPEERKTGLSETTSLISRNERRTEHG
jgi:hypothetical protein